MQSQKFSFGPTHMPRMSHRMRAPMARAASNSAARRPASTKALPEAATALTLAILPWIDGCDQGLNSNACGGTSSSGHCQSMYQSATPAGMCSFRQAVLKLPAPPVHSFPQASIPTLASAATVQQLNCSPFLDDSKGCSNHPELAPSSSHLVSKMVPIAYIADSLQTLGEAESISSVRSGLEGSTHTSLVPVRDMDRGIWADARPCELVPGAGSSSEITSSSRTNSHPGIAGPGRSDIGQDEGSAQTRQAAPAAELLSDEARGFLRDELDAELQKRTRELTEAAWQTLE
ncbi:hypothetical protein DUNSADRAFT_6402 [Dunaliella salina]|uniref:Encoded protein n=1 Tax=Dunaliella salina TaxID=3046 RepID=A0ABQ7H6S8_DUNSA|nr:hypothetical protein DUNSADRAFT_6402 [Dunaliella salina]|eukprot:KAF5842552.1 hypothetical protein DUNSADRAFT_6402 [Dunaliella salina]